MLSPRDESDLSEVVRQTRSPLRITGGGTRPIGNPVEGDALSLAGLSGITLYEPGALTVVAKAGTPVAEIEAALAAENQRLPFEPMDHRTLLGTEGTPTIGGVVAANVSGPRRIQAGACRDGLIGVRFVDGMGTVLKNGGRVMKNVTGYDLVKLMAGNYGTLGVLSEVSFKVLPATASMATVMIAGLTAHKAVAAMSAALASPFEVTGAAHVPEAADGQPATLIRIEGFEASVAYRAGELQTLLARFGGDSRIETDPDALAPLWRGVRDAAAFAGTELDVWRISVKPTDGPSVAGALPDAKHLFDWGGGLVWAGVAPGTDVRAALTGIAGHATLIRASDETRARLGAFHPEPAPVAALSAGLRKKFDPRGILNPGLMG
ncbi:FAD-binding protein [Ovoidimarina sediminis]|uniref:FAD-binding protein n=1 Tax=Ovoidimarina sediminis TaxID=3079856 RepID=UPI0029146479|nr:FAD-binding protein [Rhodophyticola sp. MJ-SS7]MDU8943684.1 FAD-binding protein [Rhodophyticola sp. MJ-SS7]